MDGGRARFQKAFPGTAATNEGPILETLLEQGERDPSFETFGIGDRGGPSGTLASGIGDVSALPSSSPFSWLFGSPDLPCICLGFFGSPKPFFESM